MDVASAALAGEIGVVGRRNEADGLCGTREQVADRVGQNLKLVGLEPDVIVDDIVVGGAGGSLQAAVCYAYALGRVHEKFV